VIYVVSCPKIAKVVSIKERQDGLLLALLQQSPLFLRFLAQQYFVIGLGQGYNQRLHKNQQEVVLPATLQKQANRFKVGMKALIATTTPLLNKSRTRTLHLAETTGVDTSTAGQQGVNRTSNGTNER
jgi:hypothetical protein